ncbi:hypothetical protein N7510_000372 [Penicillium lagena]|uniref:uncharacterized protein n=1 Tax=Penicillium lagena TaxID=94218 RepID=UPI002541938B|nr:uncharacterized protein N7510_000372 [Penicillium lagena]KAJ5624063.1 hypothetical protein N7510_000372 [Penicillium lagena]
MPSAIKTGLLCSLAAPALGAVWEKATQATRNNWVHVGAPKADEPIQLSIALNRQNLDQIDSKLAQLATPGNAKYGEWMANSDIEREFPVVDDAKVVQWLKNAGVKTIKREGGLLSFAAPLQTVNKLLDTEFAYYQQKGSVQLRTTQYSIPDDLSNDIDLITPTVFFGNDNNDLQKTKTVTTASVKSDLKASNTKVSPACETSITPSCLKEMYNVGDYVPEPSAGSRIGFGSFLNQTASISDLIQYEKLFDIPSQSFTVKTLNGGVDNQTAPISDVTESNLDVQLIVAVSHPLPVHEFITGGVAPFLPDADEPSASEDQNEPYMYYYEYLLSQDPSKLPQVISNSYGDDEQTVPEKFAKRVCNLIGLNTLRGITIIHSSGDEGVGSACQAQDGITPQFNPIFPATCPYVTAVGGTSDVAPEVAWNASSGGFSSYFEQAWYQKNSVNTYLSNLDSKVKKYYSNFANFKGRGFPDVSSHSLYPDFEVIYGGEKAASGGTSAAAPTFAGIVGLLNDARLRAGKPALGFLNPWLYSEGFKALNDITAGGSYGCGGIDPQSNDYVNGSLIIPYAHWNATEGWDPVTGLGTPNFQKLKKLVLSL